MNPKDDLMRAGEVSDQYGFSRSTLYRYEEEGLLMPAYTPGGQRRYKRENIEGLITSPDVDTSSAEGRSAHFREFGSTGLNRWNRDLYEDPLRELRGRRGRKLLREMRLNDPVIAAIFFAVENAMKQATVRVAPASDSEVDVKAADFVDSCLTDMSYTWSDTFSFILQCLEQGFSILETVYKRRLGDEPDMYVPDPATSQYDDGLIGWRKWSPRPADTLVDGDEFIFDNHGGIQGINHELPSGENVTIGMDKLLLFRTTVAPAGNPFGLPIHRAMYSSWWYSTNIQEIEGIGFERDIAGLPVIYLGNDATLSGPQSDYQMALDLVRNIRIDEQAGVVIPKPKLGTAGDGKGILLELLASTGRRQFDSSKMIDRYDKRKALSVLAQFIMLGMESVGSFALSKEQGDLFTLSVNAWLNTILDVVNRYAIPPLIKLNQHAFVGMTKMPKMVVTTSGVPNLEELSTYVNTLVQQDVLTPDMELERHLRQVASLPPAKEKFDEQGNPVDRQDIPLEKSALLVRRVGLAINSLIDTGAMELPEAAALMRPLLDELRAGINTELGVDIGDTLSSVVPVPPSRGSGAKRRGFQSMQPTDEEKLQEETNIPPDSGE